MKTIIILILFVSLHFNIFGQSTSNELGQVIFNAFKHDSINLIDNYRLKKSELADFFSANSLDTNSTQFFIYRSKYSEVTNRLLARCKSLKKDLPWEEAELQKITLKDETGKVLPDDNKKTTMFLEIMIRSNDTPFTLLVETLLGTDKLWKIGNMISSSKGMKNESD